MNMKVRTKARIAPPTAAPTTAPATVPAERPLDVKLLEDPEKAIWEADGEAIGEFDVYKEAEEELRDPEADDDAGKMVDEVVVLEVDVPPKLWL